MKYPEALEPVVAFLRGIGMEVEYGEGAHGGFLPGVNIHSGVIHIDPDSLLEAGDVLHEAGHIIVVPRHYWPRLGSDLQASIEAIVAEQSGPDETPDPLVARAAQHGEQMAQAWSYAVVRHLGLPQECLFFPGSYRVAPYEGIHPFQAWIEQGSHFGPLFLAGANLTGFSGLFAYMGNNGLAPFPQMARWSVD
ncbi:hypothetical protein [Azospirillum melinis]